MFLLKILGSANNDCNFGMIYTSPLITREDKYIIVFFFFDSLIVIIERENLNSECFC